MSEEAAPESGSGGEQEALRCDFCGETAENVRRVALDEGYDRLNQKHRVRYACAACSVRKEQERRPG